MKSKGASVKLVTFVLLVILVAICFGGAGYLHGIKGTSILSGHKFESHEKCQSACKNYKFNQGGCYWQSQAETYADPSFSSNGVKKIGSCASGFNMGRHCQGGQCNCYCYNRPGK